MAAVPFDTLALARKLEQAGFPPAQAQDTAAALAEAVASAQLVTQDYLDLKLRDLEQRLTIRLGAMMAASVAAVAALVKLL